VKFNRKSLFSICVLLVVVFLAAPCFPGNNFLGDPAFKGVWKFNVSPGLTSDSQNGQTLTNQNSVTQDTIDYNEGDASSQYAATSSQRMCVLDADLVSGFPCKSGDGNTGSDISITARFRKHDLTSTQEILGKGEASGDYDFAIYINTATDYVTALVANGDTTLDNSLTSGAAITANHWYLVVLTYDTSEKDARLYTYNLTTSTLLSDVTDNDFLPGGGFASGQGSGKFCVGSFDNVNYWTGEIDEVTVRSTVLTTPDIVLIRDQEYGAWGQYCNGVLAPASVNNVTSINSVSGVTN